MSINNTIAVIPQVVRAGAMRNLTGLWSSTLVVLAVLGTEPVLGQPATSRLSLTLKAPMAAEQNPLLPAFTSRDKDSDNLLTEAEYVDAGGRDVKLLKREFRVFDADQDGRLTFAEFVTIPMAQPEDQRGVIDDPVIRLAESRFTEIMDTWEQLDQNRDGAVTKSVFHSAAIGSLVPGMESVKFPAWDQNGDGLVSREEVARTLEIAYGIRSPAGELLRNSAGRVVDWQLFRRLKVDAQGMVSRADYFEALGGTENKDVWFKSIDHNRDGQFNYAEFATGDHRTDPVGTFLNLDQDLNGTLSRQELEALPDGWRVMAKFSFQGFDEDKDGAICLREYQLMPHCNLLTGWLEAVDANNDGHLSLTEFHLIQGLPLTSLTAEYFHRLDIDGDDLLSLDEFQFQSQYQRPNEIYAQLPDGSSVSIAFPDFPIVYSPEISPDGKWVAVDGWKNGEPNTAAHVLVANIETDEVRDFGIGCIPHWSADGKQIGYSCYNKGVYLCDFDQPGGPAKLIDAQGWSIHFSRDGLKAAYVKNGDNFIIYDLATGEKRLVFPEENSPYRYIEHNFTWSADSRRLCFKGHRPNGGVDVGIVSAAGGDPQLKVRFNGSTVQSDFAWHPDGKRIMFPRVAPGSSRSQIHELEADTDGPIQLFATQPNDRNVIGISFSRDGSTFAFMTTNDGSRP